MFVCTIAAEAGTGGEALAGRIAARGGVRLFDRPGLIELVHEVDPGLGDLEDVESRVASRLAAIGVGFAMTAGVPEAVREFELRKTLGLVAHEVLGEAAREPSVILAAGGFAALQDHPCAVHVRLRAPFSWRVDAYRREELVDRRCAERAVKRDDHLRRAWVKTIYHVDIDDPAHFALVVDASRMTPDRIADAVLAAGGVDLAAVS